MYICIDTVKRDAELLEEAYCRLNGPAEKTSASYSVIPKFYSQVSMFSLVTGYYNYYSLTGGTTSLKLYVYVRIESCNNGGVVYCPTVVVLWCIVRQ
jgi:hypothetical protein